MSEFLENLKKAIENEEFNSNVAKKINDINELADDIIKEKTINEIDESVKNRIKEKKKIDKDDIKKITSEYQNRMREMARDEKILAIITTLDNIDYEIERKKDQLQLFLLDLIKVYNRDDDNNSMLFEKVDKLINKYKFNITK